MTLITQSRVAVIAEPLAENSWRVCGAKMNNYTMGYISELGGTYEVRVLHSPGTHCFVATFKEAMECFDGGEL